MVLSGAMFEILERTSISMMRGDCIEMIMLLVPIWFAFLIGVVFGWAWKPRWVCFVKGKKLECVTSKTYYLSSPPSASPSPLSPVKGFGSAPCLLSFTEHEYEKQSPSCKRPSMFDNQVKDIPPSSEASRTENVDFSEPRSKIDEASMVTEKDLEYLCQLVEKRDEEHSWIPMLNRSTPCMSCHAWRIDSKNGPPQYCTRTIYEDAKPETVRDFFWDDEFRLKWDDMLAHAATVEECPTTGTMVVHWIRKFPLFCSDREYTIGRRIWASGRSYYCVTKAVPCPSVPRHDKPRRVDEYYSSWCIQPVASSKGTGLPTACEVIFFHYEDMGIPFELPKLAVRQGMWKAAMKTERGLLAYQKERESGTPLSHSSLLAQFNTQISSDHLKSFGSCDNLLQIEEVATLDKPVGRSIPKLLVFSGAVILACSLDQGILIKAVIFGIGRRIANIRKTTIT